MKPQLFWLMSTFKVTIVLKVYIQDAYNKICKTKRFDRLFAYHATSRVHMPPPNHFER